MINPNEIHSIVFNRTWEGKPRKVRTRRVSIYQTDVNNTIRLLYNIFPVKNSEASACQFHVDVYILGNAKKHFIRHILEEDIDKFIDDLEGHFERGRYLVRDRLHLLPNAMGKTLSYKQIKRILTFEKNASKFPSEQPIAIRTANPKLITTHINCGKYFLEVFNKSNFTRPHYAYSTFDVKTNEWLIRITS